MKSGRWEVEEKSSGIADKKIGSAGLVRAAPPPHFAATWPIALRIS